MSQDKRMDNKRYLFVKQDCNKIDISKALNSIDKKIIESKKLDFFKSTINLEFFCHPSSADFYESQINIGRFITGFEQQVFDELNYKDYAQEQLKLTSVEFLDSWKAFFQTLEDKVPKENQKWKLSISDDFSEASVQYVD